MAASPLLTCQLPVGTISDTIGPMVDPSAQPVWHRTGYKFFPYAAKLSGQWWVLRFNYGFPEHDMYTLFVDGQAAVDVTGNVNHRIPLAASVGELKPFDSDADEPVLAPELAETAVSSVAPYVVYGSEVDDPRDWCGHLADHDPMTRLRYEPS
jgi:hypothetical protein